MSNYPIITIDNTSNLNPITDNEVMVGTNGEVRAASNNTVYDSYQFSIKHSHISTALKDSIMEHYENHRRLEFNYYCILDYKTYFCYYESEPNPRRISDDKWDVSTKLRGH